MVNFLFAGCFRATFWKFWARICTRIGVVGPRKSKNSSAVWVNFLLIVPFSKISAFLEISWIFWKITTFLTAKLLKKYLQILSPQTEKILKKEWEFRADLVRNSMWFTNFIIIDNLAKVCAPLIAPATSPATFEPTPICFKFCFMGSKKKKQKKTEINAPSHFFLAFFAIFSIQNLW